MNSAKPGTGIIKDKVSLEQYKRLNYAAACEDCTHFDHLTETCTFGFPTAPHLKRNQIADITQAGLVAFCRTMEID